jgi:hypothetical protein
VITVINGDFVEQLWVKVIVGGKSLYVCSVYLPPNCDAALYEMHTIIYLILTGTWIGLMGL